MLYLIQSLIVALIVPYALAADYLVGVGKDETTGKKGVGFDPSVINPAAGDVITFEFRSGQHSVVQSSFDNPCVGSGGFNSGVQTVSDSLDVDAAGLPTVKLTVNDTNSLWFFDEAGGDCTKGAVLAVNPTQAQTAAAFKDNAAKAPTAGSSSSSQTIVSATDSSLSVSSASATSSSTPSTTTSNSGEASRYNPTMILGNLFTVIGIAFL